MGGDVGRLRECPFATPGLSLHNLSQDYKSWKSPKRFAEAQALQTSWARFRKNTSVTVPMHVGGTYSGTVSGVMNMVGSLAASMSPIVFGVQRGLWITPFFISAGVLFTGALIWTFLIDPERSVVEDMTTRGSA